LLGYSPNLFEVPSLLRRLFRELPDLVK